jgi:hypothetical protein
MRDYGADLGTVEDNDAAREYGYRARQAANRMQLYGAWSDALFEPRLVSPHVIE